MDCADRAISDEGQAKRASKRKPKVKTEDTAMMYTMEWHKDKNCTHLRVVDPMTDPHVWAIVDEACNSVCHGEEWHKNAQEKWKRMGYNSYLTNPGVTN